MVGKWGGEFAYSRQTSDDNDFSRSADFTLPAGAVVEQGAGGGFGGIARTARQA